MKKQNKGVIGRNIKIQLVKSESILMENDEDKICKGKIIGVGPLSNMKIGQTVIFLAFMKEKVEDGENVFWYLLDSDESIKEVL